VLSCWEIRYDVIELMRRDWEHKTGNSYSRRWDPRVGEVYYEHRAVAAWRLGRPLRRGEIVYHENGDGRDNHPDNIRVLENQRAYMLYRNYREREARGIIHLFGVDEFLRVL